MIVGLEDCSLSRASRLWPRHSLHHEILGLLPLVVNACEFILPMVPLAITLVCCKPRIWIHESSVSGYTGHKALCPV